MKTPSLAVLVLSGAFSPAFSDEPFLTLQGQLKSIQRPVVMSQEQVNRLSQEQSDKREFIRFLETSYSVELEPILGRRCGCEDYEVSKEGKRVGEFRVKLDPNMPADALKLRTEQNLQIFLADRGLPSSGIQWIFVQKDTVMVMARNEVSREEIPGRSILRLPPREDNCGLKNPKFDSTNGQAITFNEWTLKVVVSHDGPDVLFLNVVDKASKVTYYTIFKGCLYDMKEPS